MIAFRSNRRRGLTLLEVMISSSLLVVVLGVSLQMFFTFSTNVRQQVATVDLETKLIRVEKLLRTELRSVSAGSILVADPNGVGRNTRLDFRPVLGYDAVNNVPILGLRRRLEFFLDAGETLENTSQDGDRFIDEGALVLLVDSNGNGIFDLNETRAEVATQVASAPELYRGPLPAGSAFQFVVAAPSGITTGFIQIDMTLLGAEPNTATGLNLRSDSYRFAIRNP